MKQIIQIPNIEYIDQNLMDSHSTETNIINLKDYVVENINLDVFDLPSISYLCGGKFGDFIHSLSLINEVFYKTGRKGMLYIVNGFSDTKEDILKNGLFKIHGDTFTNGIENTYNDTYSIIMSQRYIKDYQLYSNQLFDINLNIWRLNNCLHYQSWNLTYKQTFNIEWGTHKWLLVEKDEKWKNTILINTVDYRWDKDYDFYELLSNYLLNDDFSIYFISTDEKQYNYFMDKTGLKIEFYKVDSFKDLCTAIHSCHLFIGGLSAPLSIACALHVQSICLSDDFVYYKGLDKIWNHFVCI